MKAKELYPPIFGRHAEAYQRRLEDVMARGETRGRSRVLEALAARPGMRVLDVACGPGTLSARIASRLQPGGGVVGIDLALGMVQQARKTAGAGMDFAVMDMERLAFGDAVFDAAACGHGLHFAPDLVAALAQTRRVLKPGAVFAASIPTTAPSQDVWVALDGVMARRLPPEPEPLDCDLTRKTLTDPGGLAGAARRAGFAGATVELVDERVHWQSVEQLIAATSTWWDCASRLEEAGDVRRDAFLEEATAALRKIHPGRFETVGRTLVLVANA